MDEAWPNLSFEKVDDHRASLLVGMFIQGTLAADAAPIAARIEDGNLFAKVVDYVIEQAGPETRIADADLVAAWLSAQATPLVNGLKQLAEQHKHMADAKKEFVAAIESQLEVPGPHQQQLKAIYLKYTQEGGNAAMTQGVG